MKQNEHGRILAAAAKLHLVPLGCSRKGQSRVWFQDHGWWLVQIEFQPSAWSKGSYLNVGASWLFAPGPLAFHYGDRVGNLFISYESREQFEPEADGLAKRAADEVRRLEDECSSIEKVSALLLTQIARDATNINLNFCAGVVAGLIGHLNEAERNLRLVEDQSAYGEQREAAVGLRSLLPAQTSYARAVEGLIQRKRTLHKLPELPQALPCFESGPQ